MGERKVLNKYYSPDFDHSKLPPRKQPKNRQIKVRTMLPMSIRCTTCGEYMGRGTKFNSRKEDPIQETYLGIQISRFYIKCTRCSAELTMKTDPQNLDYVVESGATRNFEPWRAKDENEKRKRDSEEIGHAMKSLENRMVDSKREMDRLAALDELKSLNSTHAAVSSDELLAALKHRVEEKKVEFNAEDEALIKSTYQGSKAIILRIDDEYDDDDDIDEDLPHVSKRKRRKGLKDVENWKDSLRRKGIFDIPKDKDGAEASKTPKFIFKSCSVNVSVAKKQNSTVKEEKPEKGSNVDDTNAVLQALGNNYDSDEDD